MRGATCAIQGCRVRSKREKGAAISRIVRLLNQSLVIGRPESVGELSPS
jgi:hypothetical protein